MVTVRLSAILVLFAWATQAFAIGYIEISADTVSVPGLQAKQVHIGLDVAQEKLAVKAAFKRLKDQDWAKATLNCSVPTQLHVKEVFCQKGLLDAKQFHVPFQLKLHPQAKGVQFGLDLKSAR